MSGSAPRILISGDVCGHLSALFKRVAAVNKSNGPFDVLFCVGQFFPLDPSGIEEAQEYIKGIKQIPLPTYFTGDYGEGAGLILSAGKAKAAQAGGLSVEGIPVCHNLVWLKGSGVVNIHVIIWAGLPGQDYSNRAIVWMLNYMSENMIANPQGQLRRLELRLRVAYLGGKFSAALYQDAKGASSAGAYHEDDVDALRAFADDKAVTDLFLSNEWPQGVTLGVDLAAVPSNVDKSTGTAILAELAADLKPRYHIAGTEEVFYARDPYLNPRAVHSTRFIGLAAVGNDKKQKFLHALSPTPAALLSSMDLAVRAPNLTVSPYELVAGIVKKIGGGARASNGTRKDVSNTNTSQGELEDFEGQYWRYDTSRSKRQKRDDGDRVCVEFVTKGSCSREGNCRFRHELEDGTPIPKGVCFDFITKGKCERGTDCIYRHSLEDSTGKGEFLPAGVCFSFFRTGSCDKGAECRFSHNLDNPMPRPHTGPCWFCLSTPDVGTHLVISVGDQCYCALAKGPIMQGHMLLLPIEHFPSTVSLPSDAISEIQKYKQALRTCYESQGSTIIVFERYIQLRAGTHAHLQVFPVPLLKALGARNAFVEAGKKEGFEFQEISPSQGFEENLQALKEIVKGQNYFFVELSDNTILVHPFEAGTKMSMQFGREVMANIMGQLDRADWKACTQTKDEETDMANEFKQQFLNFDPIL